MIAYTYDKDGIYTGQINCQESPLEKGKYLLPKNATFEKPNTPSNKIAVWDVGWNYHQDNRGTYYETATKKGVFVYSYDEDISGLTKDIPSEHDYWDGSKWVEDEEKKIENLKSEKIAEIDTKSKSLIYEGFEHNSESFSMSDQAQTNYLGLSVKKESLTFPYKLTTLDDSEYSVADLTELETIIDKAFIHKETILASGRALKVQVKACTTQSQLSEIEDNR